MGATRLPDAFPPVDRERAADLLARLRLALREEGLFIVLPLGLEAFDAACATRVGSRATELLPEVAGLLLVGDGGPTFFERFQSTRRASAEGDNPLDEYTRSRVEGVVARVLHSEGIPCVVRYPFGSAAGSPLPFQRLGCAAGMTQPGPLGLQIHPIYGPWWAYRALLAMALPLESGREAFQSACPGCTRPCVTQCAVHGLAAGKFATPPTTVAETCGDGCGARGRCPVGVDHRYADAQVAFHARAREALAAAWATGRPR